MDLNFVQKDRAAGSLIGMACGDALGAGYEFGSRVPFTTKVDMVGTGSSFAPGEWTDDTAMAIVIAEVAATGIDLREKAALDQICEGWRVWKQTAADVGIQTSKVISRGGTPATADAYLKVAAELHAESQHTAGNGSLMRTAPVALAYLDDRVAMAEAAAKISSLTHFDSTAGDACVLWCEAIRISVLTGELTSPRAGIDLIPSDRQDFWNQVIDEAEAKQPHEFKNNGWVISAFQAAWSAIVNTGVPAFAPTLGLFPARQLIAVLHRAVRVDNDTDTVAAIAGQLIGAAWGAGAVPAKWLTSIHGYPKYSAKDLTRLAILTVQKGKPQPGGWPQIDVTNYQETDTEVSELVTNLFISGQSALENTDQFDVVVSLSRVGQVEGNKDFRNQLRVSVLDSHDRAMNPHLAQQFLDVSDFIEVNLKSGKKVLLHCVHAHTRTPSFAVAYLMRHRRMPFIVAIAEVIKHLPGADLHDPFGSVLKSLDDDWFEAGKGLKSGKLWETFEPNQLWLQHDKGWFIRQGGVWQDAKGSPDAVLSSAIWDQVAEFDEAEALGGLNSG
jgi:ADP-ribosyl-[dinitrogen reductase] hydrolase